MKNNFYYLTGILIFLLASCAPSYDEFIEAIEEGDVETVSTMLDRGVEGSKSTISVAPIEIALINRKYQIVEKLLEYGADANYIMQNGQDLFDYSIDNLMFEIISPLIKHGANFNKEIDGEHIAFYLLGRRQMETLAIMIDYGLDRQIYDRSGNNLLGAAILQPFLSENDILTLIKHGIGLLNPDARGRSSYSLLMAVKDNSVVLHILSESSINFSELSSPWTQLIYVWDKFDRTEVAEFLLNSGVPIDPPHEFPLHTAVRAVDFEALKWFLENGANPNRRDDQGNLAEYYTWNYGGTTPIEEDDYWLQLIQNFHDEINKYR